MKDSQASQILKQLRIAPLTPMQALYAVGTMRLGARIYDLRQDGHQIKTDMVSVGDKRVARYRLIKERRR